MELEKALKMRAHAIREELAKLKIGWADCYEKTDLARRLAEARARGAQFSKTGTLMPGIVGTLNAEQLRQELSDSTTPLLLDVFATWCGPCKLIAPQLDSIAESAGMELRVAKMDSDLEQNMASDLRVQGLPTLIFYRPGDSGLMETHRFEGVPGNAATLRDLVKTHLNV